MFEPNYLPKNYLMSFEFSSGLELNAGIIGQNWVIPEGIPVFFDMWDMFEDSMIFFVNFLSLCRNCSTLYPGVKIIIVSTGSASHRKKMGSGPELLAA